MRLVVAPDKILDLCQRNGLDVSYVSHRFRFRFCPICGTEKWKIWLYEKTLAGSCFRCHTPFNLFSLFKAHGLPMGEIARLTGGEVTVDEAGVSFSLEEETIASEPLKPNLGLPSSQFFRIDEWPTHPAAKYALSRGVPPELFDQILIDIQSNAVCFLVIQEGKLVGYQLRFVNPANKNVKTYTAKDFKTGESLLEYHRPEGDLFVCEGPFNAVTAFNWGHTGLCTFGSRISQFQIDRLCFLAKSLEKPLYCAFDMDDAGWHAYLQVKDVCSGRGIEVVKVEPETGNDLNDSWKAGKKWAIAHSPPSSLLQYLPDLC